jgi:RimJ/RimL family protein N-acetyltransferase
LIETERLLLRMPRLEDAEALVEALGDAETMRYIGDGSTTDMDGARHAIGRWLARWESGIGQLVAERLEDGRFVGRVGFLVWDPDEWRPAPTGEIEIGWTIVRSLWGNGYASEAALALRDWAFAEKDVARLISLIQHGNERSVRVGEKLGEQYERDIEVRGVRTRLYAVARTTAPR